jgi:nitrite reductase (NADH) large subunit
MKILIVGNGVAGLSAAEEIRKRNKEANIHMITKENYYTYYRTQLSHFLSKDFNVEDIYMHPKNWYVENNIKVIFNEEVRSIDKNKQTIKLSNNEELVYDKLLLANGASSFIPPVEGRDKQGVFSLRGLDDLREIQEYAKNIDKGIVIGGGLLGLEAANSLNKLGIEIKVIEFFDRLLPRQLDNEGSKVLRKIVEEQGIKLLLGGQVENIYGENKVEGCKIKGGQDIETSLVLFSAGVRSNIQLAKELGLEINRSIVVDKFMNTSEEEIYAAGDVCEFNGKSFGIWPIAIEQGKIAGLNMIGEKQEYEEIIPSNMLNVMGSKVFSIGDVGTGEGEYESIKIERDKNNIFKKLFFLNGKLVGAILINDIAMAGKLKKLMSSDIDFSELLNKNISDEEKLNQL